jgi:hypothetical protein
MTTSACVVERAPPGRGAPGMSPRCSCPGGAPPRPTKGETSEPCETPPGGLTHCEGVRYPPRGDAMHQADGPWCGRDVAGQHRARAQVVSPHLRCLPVRIAVADAGHNTLQSFVENWMPTPLDGPRLTNERRPPHDGDDWRASQGDQRSTVAACETRQHRSPPLHGPSIIGRGAYPGGG